MKRIEIYGSATTRRSRDIESFCRRMGYPHVFRDVTRDQFSAAELRRRIGARKALLPVVFIGSFRFRCPDDLIRTEPYVVQQMIGE